MLSSASATTFMYRGTLRSQRSQCRSQRTLKLTYSVSICGIYSPSAVHRLLRLKYCITPSPQQKLWLKHCITPSPQQKLWLKYCITPSPQQKLWLKYCITPSPQQKLWLKYCITPSPQQKLWLKYCITPSPQQKLCTEGAQHSSRAVLWPLNNSCRALSAV